MLRSQPVRLTTDVITSTRLNKVVTTDTLLFDTLHANLIYDSAYSFSYDSIVRLKSIDPSTDSIGFKFLIKLTTNDNSPKIPKDITTDYDTVVYKGIDFRSNDTTSTSFHLTNYYAYDDGVAERAINIDAAWIIFGLSIRYVFMHNRIQLLQLIFTFRTLEMKQINY
ncbi:MAG: hypothetical protein QM734_00680 [Cyclobacteriaceae bacterium]